MAFLEVNDIKKSFGKNEILKGISFDLQKGEGAFYYRLIRLRQNNASSLHKLS